MLSSIMIFRTELNIPNDPVVIRYDDQIFLLGSCFSENIGLLLQKYKFRSAINPFGTLYDPISIAFSIKSIIEKWIPSQSLFIRSNEIYYHPAYHSILSDTDPDCLASRIKDSTFKAHSFLKETKHVFITLGTALGWKQKDTGHHVANCHKMPASHFERYEITVTEGFHALEQMILRILEFNPSLHIIFTVSPVRHTRSGIIENNRSKARLTLMIDALQKKFPSVQYFPAFEWMVDDLRDYRYYNDDLVHPNNQAIAYIWEKFQDCYFDAETRALADRILKVVKAAEHRPSHSDTDSYRNFCKKQTEEIKIIHQMYPNIDFTKEMAVFG